MFSTFFFTPVAVFLASHPASTDSQHPVHRLCQKSTSTYRCTVMKTLCFKPSFVLSGSCDACGIGLRLMSKKQPGLCSSSSSHSWRRRKRKALGPYCVFLWSPTVPAALALRGHLGHTSYSFSHETWQAAILSWSVASEQNFKDYPRKPNWTRENLSTHSETH